MVLLFVTTAWSIWHHRNKSCLQQSSLPLNKIAGYAKDYIRGFKNLQQQQQIVCRKIPNEEVQSFGLRYDEDKF